MNSRHARGFSMIELLVALSLVGIILGVAVNGFSNWISRIRIEETATSLQRSLSHARSEAIKHGGRIRLCGSDNGSTCGSSFSSGWLVFLDADGSAQVNDGENIISQFNADDGDIDIEMEDTSDNAAIAGISYNHRGYADLAASITVTRSTHSSAFTMSRTGHIE